MRDFLSGDLPSGSVKLFAAREFQFVKPEIVVRLLRFQLVRPARFIDRKGDEPAREIIRDRRTPFDQKSIVMPVFRFGDEVRRWREAQNHFTGFFRDDRVNVKGGARITF
jgi:hypothetical protein